MNRKYSYLGILFLIIILSPLGVSADISGFEIKASNPPSDEYTDLDMITFSWSTPQVSDANLIIDGISYSFSDKTTFEKAVGPFSAGRTIGYSLIVLIDGNTTDTQSGSINIEHAVTQISVNTVNQVDKDVTVKWMDTVKRTLTVKIENAGKRTGEVHYSYNGDQSLKSWMDKTDGKITAAASSDEKITFTISVPYTAVEKTYTGEITFVYGSYTINVPITIVVSYPNTIPKIAEQDSGNLAVGSTRSISLSISEAGHFKKLYISGVTPNGYLTLINYPHEIEPGGEGSISLKLSLPEDLNSKSYSDEVRVQTNVGEIVGIVEYNIPFPELYIKPDLKSYEVSAEIGSSKDIPIRLSVGENEGYNNLKNVKLAYKWMDYPGKNPDIVKQAIVNLDVSYPRIKRSTSNIAQMSIKVPGTMPYGKYTVMVTGSASNNNNKISNADFDVCIVPYCIMNVTKRLEGLTPQNSDLNKIKALTLSTIETIRYESVDDSMAACILGGDVYDFIAIIENTKYPTSMDEATQNVQGVSDLHAKSLSLMSGIKHFKGIDLEYSIIKNEADEYITTIVSRIQAIQSKTLFDELKKYQNMKQIYLIVGSDKSTEFDTDITKLSNEISNKNILARESETKGDQFSRDFNNISKINYIISRSDSKQKYATIMEHYESADSIYSQIGNSKVDNNRVSKKITARREMMNQLETSYVATITFAIVLFGVFLIDVIAVERKRRPEKRIEKSCKKIWS